MKNLKDKKVLVYDTGGEYVSIAQRLAKDYEEVFYCVVWQDSFPKWNSYSIGMGIEQITRVDSPFEVLDLVDLIVIPDLYLGSFADWLRDKGYKVFGSGSGENMEIFRHEFYDFMVENNMPTPKFEKIKGFTKLKKYLKDKENLWIKTSLIRGNGETFNYKNSRLSESRLDEMQHNLGAFKEEAMFIVSESIDDCVEVGHDTFTISGKYPEKCLYGLEVKDSSYISKVVNYSQLPQFLQDIDKKFATFYKENTYNGYVSTEVRWNGKRGYLGDITLRSPQPPSDLQQLLYENFSEIIWNIAHGEVPEIKAPKKYGVQIIIKSDWALNEPQAVYFPEKYKDNVKIKHLMVKDGIYYFIPTTIEMCEIGSVVATGNTLKEAIEEAKKIASTVEGDSIKVDADALEDAQEEIDKFKKFGLPTI